MTVVEKCEDVADELLQAINIVNNFNRAGGKPLVCAVLCCICGKQFAAQMQSTALVKAHRTGSICPSQACQDEARRQRQRGERLGRRKTIRTKQILQGKHSS